MNPSWVQPLGWALVHCLWQLTIVALCYRAAEPLLRHRPLARYAGGLTMLFLSVILVGSTLAVQRAPAFPEAGAHPHAPAARSASHDAGHSALAVAGAVTRPSAGLPERIAAVLERYLEPIVAIWLLGLGIVAWRFRRDYRACRQLSDSSAPATSLSLLACVAECGKRLGVRVPVEVRVSSRIDSPILVGWRKPRILLPPGLEAALSPEEIQAFVAHELAHVKRRDYPVNLVQTAIERLLFFHPAIRWLSRAVRAAREHCCDDLAAAASIGGAVGYARSLVRLEELRATPAVALGVTDSDLLGRIRRLLARENGRAGAAAGRQATPLRSGNVTSLAALITAGVLLHGGVWIAGASTAARTVLGGLDPVLLIQGIEVQGSPALSLHSSGYRYLFANRDNLESFRGSPMRYSVQNVASCPVTGNAVRPDAWRLIDGRIVLFCCNDVAEPVAERALLAQTRPAE